MGDVKEEKLSWATVNLEDEDEIERFETEELDRAEARIQEAARTLKERGIVDENGRRIRDELPPDMQPGSKTDV